MTQRLFVLAASALALASVGCGPPPRMLVTGSLATTTAYEVTARPGMFTGSELVFEPYRATGWREQWTAQDTQLFAERFSDFGGAYAYAFTLTRGGTSVREVGCRADATLEQTDATRRLYSYTVRCSIWAADRSAEAAFAQVDLTGGGELGWNDADEASGQEGSVWGVQPVLMSADGRARQDPYGYQMVGAEGAFAAVQADPARVWIDASADEALQHDAAALSAALVEAYHWSVAHMRTAR